MYDAGAVQRRALLRLDQWIEKLAQDGDHQRLSGAELASM
jgi:hypothetical protein